LQGLAKSKNILFFIIHPIDENFGEKHSFFIKALTENINCNVSFCAESRNYIPTTMNNLFTRSVNYIEESIDFENEVKQEILDTLMLKYRKYRLNKVTLPFSGKNHFNDRSQYSLHKLGIYLKYFDDLINPESFDAIIILPIFNSTNNSFVPLLSAVCDMKNIKYVVMSKPGLRLRIEEGNCLSSKKMNDIYLDKKVHGLSLIEKEKTRHAIKSYINFKKSTNFQDLIYKRRKPQKSMNYSLRHNTIKLVKLLYWKNLIHFIIKKAQTDKLGSYDKFDYKKNQFVIFLPNKQKNHRTSFIGSYYSNFISIIRNIAISLPPTHWLVVKVHPHDAVRGGDKSIKDVCNSLPNVIYIDAEIDTFDVINYADIIFSIASVTGFEALFLNKHVVVFGEEPYFFGKYKSPVTKLLNFEELPLIIDKCLSTNPDKKDILAYIYSYYASTTSHSLPMLEDDWSIYEIGRRHLEIQYNNATGLLVDYLKD